MPRIGELAERTDLRMPLLGLAAWAGALVAHAVAGGWLCGAAVAAAAAGGVLVRRRGRAALATVAAVLLVGCAVAGVTWLRAATVHRSPVADLAQDGAVVSVTGRVVSDPRTVEGRFERRVVVRLDVRGVTGRGSEWRLRAPVLVIGGAAWLDVPLGADVATSGRLAPADDDDLAGVLVAARDPDLVAGPDVWWRAAGAVRTSIRESVAGRPIEQRALVPALVDGDDAELPEELERDFRTTGLTHLTAVSGTNLTLVVGFLLVLARWCGVRRRWLYVVGAGGDRRLRADRAHRAECAAGRGDGRRGPAGHGRERPAPGAAGTRGRGGAAAPGPARAGGLGGVRAVGARHRRHRDPRAGLARRADARGCRAGSRRRSPSRLAAQLACTPVVAAMSGQVSLVAVAANLAVAPVVGPATVLGLAGGLVGLVVPRSAGCSALSPAGASPGSSTVAERGADLPAAAVGWGTGGAGARRAHRADACSWRIAAPRCCAARSGAHGDRACSPAFVRVRWPTPGWPPPGWVLAMCDVGQGDALVLTPARGAGVVVDAGPDPRLVDGCLRRLGIDGCRCWCSPTSTPTTSTGCPASRRSRGGGGADHPGARPAGRGREVGRLARAAGWRPRPGVYGATATSGR